MTRVPGPTQLNEREALAFCKKAQWHAVDSSLTTHITHTRIDGAWHVIWLSHPLQYDGQQRLYAIPVTDEQELDRIVQVAGNGGSVGQTLHGLVSGGVRQSTPYGILPSGFDASTLADLPEPNASRELHRTSQQAVPESRAASRAEWGDMATPAATEKSSSWVKRLLGR